MSEQTFLNCLQRDWDHGQHSDLLLPFRRRSWQKFSELGLPSKSHEAFRYIPLRELSLFSFKGHPAKQIDKALFSDAILPECAHSHLVFLDGAFCPDYSDVSALSSQIVILPLDDAMRTHGNFLQSCFTRSLKEEQDPFAILNFALHPKGAFIYVPPHIELASPLQCLYVISGSEAQWQSPRLHLALGAHSSMRLITTATQLHSDAAHFSAPAMELTLDESASMDVLMLTDASAAWHFESLRASLKKHARFNSINMTTGGKAIRQSYRIQLKGENAEANLNGLWMLSGNRTAHTHALVEHEAPHTRSMQHFKGVLNDHSQSSFEGKILVRPEAQKTEAYQLNNNLILKQGAIANAKPNLEIFADDVKASHGATVSQLDEDQLFYLSTRGIDLFSARRLLIDGFCREMISKIPYDSLLRKFSLNLEAFVK